MTPIPAQTVEISDTKRRPPRVDPPPHSCGGCDARWGGFRIAHCAACHRTFSTPANFDRHRAGSKDGRKPGEGHDPAACGLVRTPQGYWAGPGRDAE